MDSDILVDWQEVSVEDIKAPHPHALATGPFGSSISARFFQSHGVPVIRGSNLSEQIGERLLQDDLVFISEEKARTFERSKARTGDLVFTCWGTIGQVGLIDKRSPFGEYVVSNKQMKLTPDPKRADSLFLYYLFSSPEVSNRIRNQAIGSSVPGFNLGQLRSLKLRLPSLSEQRRIATLLGPLDDKIDLNRRMNRTLEQMAQAIFKSWFVDFDGHDDLVESELGPIPRGWRVGLLGEVAENVRDQIRPEQMEGDAPYIGLADMPLGSIALDRFGRAETATSAKTSFRKGDLLFGKLRPYFKKVGIAPVDGVCSTDIVVVRPKSGEWYAFVLCVLTCDAFIEYSTAGSTGTGMPRTSWAQMSGYGLALPTAAIAKRFQLLIEPLHARLLACVAESRTLAALRDLLLPKVISGEIRISEAENAVESAL